MSSFDHRSSSLTEISTPSQGEVHPAQSAGVRGSNQAAATLIREDLVGVPENLRAQLADLKASLSSDRIHRADAKITARAAVHGNQNTAAKTQEILQLMLGVLTGFSGLAILLGTAVGSGGGIALAVFGLLAASGLLGDKAEVASAKLGAAGQYGERWVELARHARGDEKQLDAAAEQFRLMQFEIAAAVLSYTAGESSGASGVDQFFHDAGMPTGKKAPLHTDHKTRKE